jgi:hypothetical protein
METVPGLVELSSYSGCRVHALILVIRTLISKLLQYIRTINRQTSPPQLSRFDPRLGHAGFVVDKKGRGGTSFVRVHISDPVIDAA